MKRVWTSAGRRGRAAEQQKRKVLWRSRLLTFPGGATPQRMAIFIAKRAAIDVAERGKLPKGEGGKEDSDVE